MPTGVALIPGHEPRAKNDESLDAITERSTALRRRVERDARSRDDEEHRRRQAIEDSIADERRQARREELFRDLDELSRRFCDGGLFITTPNIERWRAVIAEIPVGNMPLVDYNRTPTTVSCATYLRTQALGELQSGFTPDWQSWIEQAAREGHRRETEPWPSSLPRAQEPPPAISVPTVPPITPPLPSNQLPNGGIIERPGRQTPPASGPCLGGTSTCGPINP